MNNKDNPQQENMFPSYPMAYQDNDEIDLVELFRSLWKQKAKIALVTATTTLAAGIYAFTAEEVWTSKATISPPKAADMGQFYQIAQEIGRNASEHLQVLNDQYSLDIIKKEDDVINDGLGELSLKNLRNSLYSDFKKELSSANNKLRFLSQYPISNDKLKFLGVDFIHADGKKLIYDSMALSANSPKGAKFLLEKYINHINSIALNNNKQELAMLKNKLSLDLNHEAMKLASNAQEQFKREINVLTSALSQATSLNMPELAENISFEINNDTLYLLGSKALAAKLNLLKMSSPILPSRYFEIQQQLKALNGIKVTSIEGKTFTYVDEPSEPVTKDKPKKALILILGLVLGFMLGCGGVLVFQVFQKK